MLCLPYLAWHVFWGPHQRITSSFILWSCLEHHVVLNGGENFRLYHLYQGGRKKRRSILLLALSAIATFLHTQECWTPIYPKYYQDFQPHFLLLKPVPLNWFTTSHFLHLHVQIVYLRIFGDNQHNCFKRQLIGSHSKAFKWHHCLIQHHFALNISPWIRTTEKLFGNFWKRLGLALERRGQ